MKNIFTTTVEKQRYNTNDFDKMSWHDCHIHAFFFKEDSSEFLLDIDYILQWINPDTEEKYFKFFIAPATLVFSGIKNFKFSDFAMGMEIDIEIENISMESISDEYKFIIKCTQGNIEFQAMGFKQYLRKEPVFINPNTQKLDSQKLSIKTRGGISFDF